MHSIINHADQVVNFLDWTTASLLGSSAVIIGQSMLARLRNEWHANHQSGAIPAPEPEPAPSEPEPESEPAPESANEPEPSPTPQPTVDDPWLTENQTACKLPEREETMVKHASNRRMLKEATLSTQDYHRMRKQKLIEICRAKGISANKKKTKKELAAKLGAVA